MSINEKQYSFYSTFEIDERADVLDLYFGEIHDLYRAKKAALQTFCEQEGKSKHKKKIDQRSLCVHLADFENKIKKITAQYFPDVTVENRLINDLIAQLTQKKAGRVSELLSAMKQMMHNNNDQVAHSLGCTIIEHKFSLQYKDSTTKQIKKLKTKNKDCQHFPFYKVQEKEFSYEIFCLSDRIMRLFDSVDIEGILSSLEPLGYTPVGTPEKGDIIFYFDPDKVATHLGIFVDSETVYSKQGLFKHILAHPINFVPPHYSNHYLIFRKEGAAELFDTPWILPSYLMKKINNQELKK